MIIMISYYYSISAIITLCIYAVYKYIAQSPKIDMKKMFQKGLSFCVPIIIAIISSAVLILPTFYALKSGRSPTNKEMDILKLLLPNFNIEGIVYGNYSLGLTAISLLAIITGIISNKKEQKFLTYCLLFLIFLPLGIYILNGTLYVRNKILIPQIPLVGLLVAPFIEKIINKKIDLTKLAVMIIIVIAVALGCKYQNPAFYLDTLIILGIIVCYYKNMTNEKFLILIILIIPLITLLISNSTDTYMKEESINKIESIKQQEEIQKTLDQEQNIVRFNNLTNTLENVNHIYTTEYNQNSLYSSISNPLYKEFYEKIFNNALSYRNNLVLAQNNDILFQTFMGVKYIYSEKDAPVGYQKISKNIYQNKNVLPLFYGTDKIKNEKEFDTLSYPHNIGVLLNSVITKEKTTNGWTTPIQKITPQYEVKEISNIEIKKRDEYLRIKTTKQKGKIKLKLKEPLGKDILIVNIVLINRSSCEEGDLKININEISNVLTCKEWIYKNDNNVFHYVISSNEELDSLNITFSRGVYKIKSVDVYKLKYEDLMNLTEDKDKFIINQKESVGDQIIGTITMHNNGYFVSSIPYDKGFQVKVDGKKVKTKIVNKAFLGFPLKEGKHQIKITYSAPWFKEGLVVSILGILSFFSMLMIERKSRIRK